MYKNFFDLETTDKNPNVAEVLTGYIETYHQDDLETIVDSIYIECRPEKYIDASFPIHKISRQRAMGFPPAEIGMRAFYKHLLRYPSKAICHARMEMFGKTGLFDWQVLRDYCHRKNASDWFYKNFRNWELESTHTLAKKNLHLEDYRLDTIAAHFCIKFEHHNCIQDTKAMVKIYKQLQQPRTLLDLMGE